jgi:hypothetical protein
MKHAVRWADVSLTRHSGVLRTSVLSPNSCIFGIRDQVRRHVLQLALETASTLILVGIRRLWG